MINYYTRFGSEWVKAVNDYLKVSSHMFSMWSSVLSDVHSCEMMVLEDPSKCSDKLDVAIKKAQEFEKFSHEYVMAIKKMKDVIQSYQINGKSS